MKQRHVARDNPTKHYWELLTDDGVEITAMCLTTGKSVVMTTLQYDKYFTPDSSWGKLI